MNGGSYFRGRPIGYDADIQAIEGEAQRWREGTFRPPAEQILIRQRNDRARTEQQWYDHHRDAFIETGDEEELRQMLEHVT